MSENGTFRLRAHNSRAAIRAGIRLAILFLAGHLATPASAQEKTAFPGGGDSAKWEDMAETVTIYRDSWGVPHVFGPTDASVMFGAAYARAEDRLIEDELYYLLTIGRASELIGEDGIEGDLYKRALRRERVARQEARTATPGVRALAEAYAAGVNYYLWKHDGVLWRRSPAQ